MSGFSEYIASNGAASEMSAGELNELTGRYEWFSLARIVREHITGESDPLLPLIMAGRSVSSLKRAKIDLSKLLNREPAAKSESADEIIDRFLQCGDYKIVAGDSGQPDVSEEVLTEAEFSEEDDLVSEELAEIYLSQGLKSEALAIYRRLSLRNTEKSVYFAEIIDKIENNN